MKAIITGATKGIGRAIAEKFAEEGFDLALCARTAADLAEFKMALLDKFPSREILTRPSDVSQKAEVQAFADLVKSNWQQVDVLVNNAGVYRSGEIHKEEEGIFEQLMATNLNSAYYLTRSILPLMLPHRRGHVFNMCSIASLFAYPDGGSYSISKFALLGFSKVLREELKDKGIRVTALLPGATWSDSWAGTTVPESRMMKAEDVALAVWGAWQLSGQAVVEEILLRPQLGDL